MRKSRRADTQEHKVTVAGVLNALRRVFRDAYGIARANGIRWRIADEHQAVALLDDVYLVDRQFMQLRGHAGLDAATRERYL